MPPAARRQRTSHRARRTNPFPEPPPAYSPTIDLTADEVIDLTADSDGEFVPFTPDAQCEIDRAFRRARPYSHTRRSLSAAAPYTRYERRVTRSQTQQAPTARDLLLLAEIADRMPPAYRAITLRDAHDLAIGMAGAIKRSPGKYTTLEQVNKDMREIWLELAEE